MKQVVEIAHMDSPEATWKDVDIPDVVKVFMDFSPDRQIGAARLVWIDRKTIEVDGQEVEVPGALKAICNIYDDEEIEDRPMIQCALVDAKRYLDADRRIAFITGGRVTNVSVVSPIMQREIFGAEVAGARQGQTEGMFDV
jgi:hypothetical protein